MALKVIAYPVIEPITLEEARAQCGIVPYLGSPPDTHPDDVELMKAVTDARSWCEKYLGFSVAQYTVELALDEFPTDEIDLLMGPVISIESVKYIDEDGDEQTIDEADYTLDDYSPRLFPAEDTEWPDTKDVINAVKVRYVVGHSMPGDSPQANPVDPVILRAIRLGTAEFYKNREASSQEKQELVPLGMMALLDMVRTRRGFA